MDREAIQSVFPLSFQQKGMLFHYLKDAEENAYIGQQILTIEGSINRDHFHQSLEILSQKYEAFRTRIVYSGLEEPMQVVLKETSVDWHYQENDFEDFIAADHQRGFKIEKENLIRVSLVKVGDQKYQNVWSFHHIILDGYCIGILAKDFFEIYRRLEQSEPITIEPAPSYKNYLKWLNSQNSEEAKAFWEDCLAGVTKPAGIPEDFCGRGYSEGEDQLTLNSEKTEQLERYAAENQVTVNAVTQTIWGIVLSAYSGLNEVAFGNVMAVRPLDLEQSDQMVGLFSTTVPVCLKMTSQSKVKSLIADINRHFTQSIRYAYYPIGQIKGAPQLIKTLYVFENFDLSTLHKGAADAGLKIVDLKMTDHANYALSISVLKRHGQLQFIFRYNRQRYKEATIQALKNNLMVLMDQVCSQKEIRVEAVCKKLSLSKSKDKQEIIVANNEVATERRNRKPATDIERKVSEIFSQVLGVTAPNVYDDFFELGGDSISGMKFVAICRKEGLPLSLKTLFAGSDICTLAHYIENDLTEQEGQSGSTEHQYAPDFENEEQPFALSGVQGAYLMGMKSDFELSGFTTQYYAEVDGDFDIDRLETAFNQVMAHQPALRTKIIGANQQKVMPAWFQRQIRVVDLSGQETTTQEKACQKIREDLRTRVFDADQFPYVTLVAIRLAPKKIRLCFLVECICIDGAGLMMMIQELNHYYQTGSEPLKPIEFTFRDYQCVLLNERSGQSFHDDQEFWNKKIPTLPLPAALPFKKDPLSIKNAKFARIEKKFSPKSYRNLTVICKNKKFTPAALICAAYMQVLCFWSNTDDVTINMTVFERNDYHPDVSRLIGDFTKLILIDGNVHNKGLGTLAQETSKKLAEALEHCRYDGIEVMRKLSQYHGLGTNAVMPYVFTCALKDQPVTAFDPHYAISRTPQVYIDCQATVHSGELLINWDYPEDLFDASLITEMFDQFTGLIEQASMDPKISVSEKTKNFIRAYNDTFDAPKIRNALREATLIDLIRPSFERYTNKPAITDRWKTWSYGELKQQAEKIARKLELDGVKPGDCVAIKGEKKAETVAAILGVLICGGVYVPFNTDLPEERIKKIMKKCESSFLVDADYIKNLEMDADNGKTRWDRSISRGGDLAYIIFTSGTTGEPKGVAIEHHSVVNTIVDINEKCSMSEKDCIIGLSEFGFDLSVYDVFGALSTGAKLCLMDDQKNPEAILETIASEHITFWNSVPAIMQMVTSVVDLDYVNRDLKHIYLSGDWIPVQLPSVIKKHFVNAEVVSLGGATEGSIWSIYHPIERALDLPSIPYGRPLKNQQMYILNHALSFCPIGVVGEICIGGDGVAAGYYNDLEKTREVFIHHSELGKIYRTGDYGKLHEEGYIEFLGRKDNQVKIHGFRVELGEIENCALNHSGVKQAVAVIQRKGSSEILVLFIKPQANHSVDKEALEKRLRTMLPEYMIPKRIIPLDQIPITQNGKIDRKRLSKNSDTLQNEHRYQARNDQEALIGKIICQTLNLTQIDYLQNFFEMGIDSLKAVVLLNALKKKGHSMSLTALYNNNTIEELAQSLNEEMVAVETSADYVDGEL